MLLNAGTNDMNAGIGPGYDCRVVLDQLLRDIAADRPAAAIYVAELMPALGLPSLTAANAAWNAYLPGEVSTLRSAGLNVTAVPMYAAFALADGSANPALYSDAVHPNAAGYAIMGDAFAAAVEANNPVAAVPEPATAVLLAASAIGLLGRRRRA